MSENNSPDRFAQLDAVEGREKKVKEKYAREGFEVRKTPQGWGYYTPKLRMCPSCGSAPTIAPYIDDQNDPPTKFVIMCNKCYLRVDGEHSPEECVALWNKGKFGKLSVQLCEKPKDIMLVNARAMVITAARLSANDAIHFIRNIWEITDEMAMRDKCDCVYADLEEELGKKRQAVEESVNFLRNVGGYGRKAVDKIKILLYPDSSIKDREEMPKYFSKFPEPDEMKTLLYLNRTEKVKGGHSMAEVKARTKRFWTDYGNHMIRFFLTTEESLVLNGKQKEADLKNWLAVQNVFRALTDDEKNAIRFLFDGNDIVKQVHSLAELKAMDVDDVWTLLYRFTKKCVKSRGDLI